MFTFIPTAPYFPGTVSYAGRHEAGRAHQPDSRDSRARARPCAIAELRALLQPQILQFRPIRERLLTKIGSSWSGSGAGMASSASVEGRLVRQSHRRRQIAPADLTSFCACDQQQLRLGQIDVGEADVQCRFQLALGQRGDLVGDQFAGVHSLFRDL